MPPATRETGSAGQSYRTGLGLDPGPWLLKFAAVAIAIVTVVPIAAVVLVALRGGHDSWPHLAAYVLPVTISQTLWLCFGVGVATLVTGTACAWVVTMYRFPGRAILDRLLVMPLAIPTYIVAYCYVELLTYGGPVQSWLRAAGGYSSARDYWFPDIHSLPGAILVITLVLYPYIYLSARASFVQQSVCALEVARTLGRTPLGAFATVALPLARPALAVGLALVLMETLNDLGAVQYLGVETLSASIYSTWLQRSDLAGAGQLASLALICVIAILMLERFARGESRFHHTTGRYRAIPFQDLDGWRGLVAAGLCFLPVLAGFFIPIAVLLFHALAHIETIYAPEFWIAMANSISVSAAVAALAVLAAIVLAYARRISRGHLIATCQRIAGLGYAVPGTVMAIGVLYTLGAVDTWMTDGRPSANRGWLLSGTLVAVTLALVVRFFAVALGSVEAGLDRISPNLDAAARSLGATAISALVRVHLPLLLPALGAAGLLVFVDAMKELPATLLLRPLNFETLATHVYGLVALEQFERAAAGSLAIVLAGIIPVLLLHKAVASGRAGSGS